MHRITGDGYLLSGGKRIFADEDLPSRYATQVTHQWANTVQEELATIVEDAGGTLQTDAESIAQMNQVNTAIKGRIAAEASARAAADTALSNQLAGLTGTLYPGFIYNVSTGVHGAYDHKLQWGQAGKAVDSTGAILMTVPLSGGWWFKNVGNYSGYQRGYDTSAVPTGITLASGTRLYIFLLRFADGGFDLGVDTDITAANLRADPNCLATHYRRISWCYVNSMSGSNAVLAGFGHRCDGLYMFRDAVAYTGTPADWGIQWGRSDLKLPYDMTVDIVYTVAPPTGANSRVFVMPYSGIDMDGNLDANAYYAQWATISGVEVRTSSPLLRAPYRGWSSNSGMYGKADPYTGVTIKWVLQGFWDTQDRDGIFATA